MKKFGFLLMVVGIVAVALGVYGFITLSSSEFSGEMTDWAIDTFNALGGSSALSTEQSFQLALVRNRVLLTVAGAAGIIIGGLLRRKKEA